jgi:hypothetical protein
MPGLREDLEDWKKLVKDLVAPWSPEVTATLNRFQTEAHFHPFTCANRGDGEHQERDNADLGQLIATDQGWVCADCDYSQDWAHNFMADDSFIDHTNQWKNTMHD